MVFRGFSWILVVLKMWFFLEIHDLLNKSIQRGYRIGDRVELGVSYIFSYDPRKITTFQRFISCFASFSWISVKNWVENHGPRQHRFPTLEIMDL